MRQGRTLQLMTFKKHFELALTVDSDISYVLVKSNTNALKPSILMCEDLLNTLKHFFEFIKFRGSDSHYRQFVFILETNEIG